MIRSTRLKTGLAGSLALFVPLLTGIQGCPSGGTVVADSESEFSSIQGGDNWFYGYVEPASGQGFQQMTIYTEHGSWGPVWAVDPTAYWTMLSARNVMPNAVETTGEHKAVEHWPVRRWISEVSGTVTLTGAVARLTEESYSDGATARIEVDGATVWQVWLAPGDTAGMSYDLQANIERGQPIDFILEPGENDWSDETVFTATILN